MIAHTDIAATGWVSRLPRTLAALSAAGAGRPADRHLAAVPAWAVGDFAGPGGVAGDRRLILLVRDRQRA